MNLTEFAKEVHQNAVDHGWWEKEVSFGEVVALCHSEISEALEQYRQGMPLVYNICIKNGLPCIGAECVHFDDFTLSCSKQQETDKPEGVAVELADCILRILDYCGKEGIDIEKILLDKHEYNKSRPYRHGGKRL